MMAVEGVIGIRKGETLSTDWDKIRRRATLPGDPKRVRVGDPVDGQADLVAKRMTPEKQTPWQLIYESLKRSYPAIEDIDPNDEAKGF